MSISLQAPAGTKLVIEYALDQGCRLQITFHPETGEDGQVLDLRGKVADKLDPAFVLTKSGTLKITTDIVPIDSQVRMTLRTTDLFNVPLQWETEHTEVNRNFTQEIKIEVTPGG